MSALINLRSKCKLFLVWLCSDCLVPCREADRKAFCLSVKINPVFLNNRHWVACLAMQRPLNILPLGFGSWCTWQNIHWCRDWKSWDSGKGGGTWRPRSKEKSRWELHSLPIMKWTFCSILPWTTDVYARGSAVFVKACWVDLLGGGDSGYRFLQFWVGSLRSLSHPQPVHQATPDPLLCAMQWYLTNRQ